MRRVESASCSYSTCVYKLPVFVFFPTSFSRARSHLPLTKCTQGVPSVVFDVCTLLPQIVPNDSADSQSVFGHHPCLDALSHPFRLFFLFLSSTAVSNTTQPPPCQLPTKISCMSQMPCGKTLFYPTSLGRVAQCLSQSPLSKPRPTSKLKRHRTARIKTVVRRAPTRSNGSGHPSPRVASHH